MLEAFSTPHTRSASCGLIRSRVHAFRLGVVALFALLLPACNKTFDIDLSGPINPQWSMLRSYVQNSGLSEISISYQGGTGQAAAAGQTIYIIPYLSTSGLPGSDWFVIQRQSGALARVTFRPLRCPDKKGDVKDTKIIIGEPSPGEFPLPRTSQPGFKSCP